MSKLKKSDNVHLVCEDEQKRRWEKAAEKDGRSLSAWVRIQCDRGARLAA